MSDMSLAVYAEAMLEKQSCHIRSTFQTCAPTWCSKGVEGVCMSLFGQGNQLQPSTQEPPKPKPKSKAKGAPAPPALPGADEQGQGP